MFPFVVLALGVAFCVANLVAWLLVRRGTKTYRSEVN